MPRIPRKKSNSGYYHIMIRGNERRNIFHDEEDKGRFIETLSYKKRKGAFYLPAFCLMDNHVHLLIGEGIEDIARVMKRITVSYVLYFNEKYKRVGHLFQDRFRSETVENDSYMLSLARYIHKNPVLAGMVKKAEDYKWSSHNAYIQDSSILQNVIDKDVILGLFAEDHQDARKLYREFISMESQEVFDDLPQEMIENKDVTSLYRQMLQQCNIQNGDLTSLPDEIIVRLKKETGLSVRKIAEITGLNKNKVHRILKAN